MATLASAAAGSSFVQQQKRQISVETTTTASASAVGISTSTLISDCSLSQTSSSTTSSACSSLSSSCSSTSSYESGVILSGSSICSSLTSSPTSTSSSAANAVAIKPVTLSSPSSSSTSMTACLLPASQLVTAAVSSTSTSSVETTLPLSSSLSLSSSISTPTSTVTSPESITCTSLHAGALTSKHSVADNVTASSSYTSAHQLLLNGINVSDADLNATVNSSSLAEDPRTLQLALELSMVGLNDTVQQQQLQLQQLQQQHLQHMQQQQQLSQQHQQQQQSSFDMNALSAAVAAAAAAAAAANNQASTHSSTTAQLNQFSSALLPGIEDRSKKSQNMTECVPVPSSEHVAEIVGRQGCKIKALRAKTNTYIKTPVRGEEPVFVVTGRKEDVAKAKREILSAAEHFSVIRASRKPSLVGSLNGSLNGTGSCTKTPPGPPAIPGQVTIQVRVPYRVVGLVVGPKGATIKHIQQETQTYIVTPSREKEPIFEVTGLPDNVQAARKQIEAHIALRTGNLSAPAGDASGTAATSNSATVHTINSLSQILSDDVSPEFLASIYKTGICSTFDYADSCISGLNSVSAVPVPGNNIGINLNLSTCGASSQSLINDMASPMSTTNSFHLPTGGSIRNDFLSSMISRRAVDGSNAHQVFGSGLNNNASGNVPNGSILTSAATSLNGGVNHNGVACAIGMSRSCSSASSTTSSKSANNSGGSNSSRPELCNIWKNLGDSLDVDEGIGESPSIWTLPSSLATLNSHYSPATSISPTDSLLGESNSLGQLLATQTQQQHRNVVSLNNSSNTTIITQQQQNILNHNHPNLGGMRRECLICGDKEVTAALVPCGHNMFCMECANRICASSEGVCPFCSQSVFHAMRILP